MYFLACRQRPFIPVVSQKQCTSCGELLHSKWFCAGSGPTGLDSRCKSCHSLYTLRWREKKQQECESQEPAVEKRCRKCLETLPASSFSICIGHEHGLLNMCKDCASDLGGARYRNRKEHSGDLPVEGPAGKQRTCSACGCIKLWSEFYKDSRTVPGIKSICKECHLARMLENRLRKQG